MYKHLLLASDGMKESLVALREGALIAQNFGATAHLLIIDPETAATRIAEGYSMSRIPAQGQKLLDLGLGRLSQLGVTATGELIRGEPIPLIVNRVHLLKIDLIVLGHRRRSFLNRWWSGSSGGYIVDDVPCSLLVARATITDEEFETYLNGNPAHVNASSEHPR
uniref:universal stress protein n=1 Tax=uncultured Sphingomonas sp. TaxID=158754 RepID=UPI0035CA712C